MLTDLSFLCFVGTSFDLQSSIDVFSYEMHKDLNTKKCIHVNVSMYTAFVSRTDNETYEQESCANKTVLC